MRVRVRAREQERERTGMRERERERERAQGLRDLRVREMTGIHNVAGNAGNGEKYRKV